VNGVSTTPFVSRGGASVKPARRFFICLIRRIIMFEITRIVNGTAQLYKFDTIEQAQAWLKACTIAYEKVTLVVNINRNN
jgi:hypothetical protein